MNKIEIDPVEILAMAIFILFLIILVGFMIEDTSNKLRERLSKNTYCQDKGYESYDCEYSPDVCYCYKIEDGEVIKYYIDVKGGKK